MARASSIDVAVAPGGWGMPISRRVASKRRRSSARSIASTDEPRILAPPLAQRLGQVDRGLAAELHHHAHRRLGPDHVLGRLLVEGVEVQPVGGVEVGAHGLGVAVEHGAGEARVAQRHRRLHRAVVELDALADADRAGAQHQHRGRRLLAQPARRLVLGLVGRVVVRGGRGELRGARVDQLVRGPDPGFEAGITDVLQRLPAEAGEALVGEAGELGLAQHVGLDAVLDPALDVDDLVEPAQEPAVD